MTSNALNLKEVAPQFEGVLKNIKNLSNIYLKSNEAFDFGIDFLNKYFDEVAKYTRADFRQIELIGLRNFAMILSYGGFDDILAFNTLDLSVSGSGKSRNHDIQKDLILWPMLEELDAKEQESPRENEKGEKIHVLDKPVFKAYHNAVSTSPQFFLRAANETPTQMIYFDEFGRSLQRQNLMSIVDFCIENWGRSSLTAPSEHKNYLHNKPQNIKCKIFCAMNTTIAYLGKDTYIHELQGGLLNRPITYFSKKILEDKVVLEIEDEVKNRLIRQSQELMCFANKNANHQLIKNQIVFNQITNEFKDLIKIYKESYKEIYQDYFVRLEYNYTAIVITLHYLKEFDFYLKHSEHRPSDRIEDSTFQTAFYFLATYINNFEAIVSFLENKGDSAKDPRIAKALLKILDFQNFGKLPMAFSTFGAYVALKPKPKAAELRELLSPFINSDYNGHIIGLSEAGYAEISAEIKDDERSPSELFKGF